MQSRLVLPVVVISVVAAIALGVRLVRTQTRVYHLQLASGSPTGEYYAFSQAYAEVVTRNYPKIDIKVLETNGSQQNMAMLRDGEAQLALVQSDTPVEPPVRAAALLFPEMFHLIARKDTNIISVADLQGKRVALMPEGSGSYALFWPLSHHYGLDNAIKAYPMTPTEAHQALLQGQVDALFQVITLGNPAVQELLQSGEVELLSIDQVDALQLSLPYLEARVIPKGTYDGARPLPANDLNAVAVNALLVVHESLPDNVVRALTSILYENRNELVSRYPRAASIRLPNTVDSWGLPLHPGARKFYNKDQPEFLVQYAEPIGLLLSVSVLLVSSIWQFRLWLVGRQKNRADMYNLEILELIDQVSQAHTQEELTVLRQQLFQILRQVVVDLDVDRISAESFESFSFPWEIALSMIRHQEMLLRQSTD